MTLTVTESGPERSIDEAPLEVLCVYPFPIIAFPKHFIVTEDFLKKVLGLWRRPVLSILQEGRGRGSMLLACVTEDTWVSEEVRSGFLSSPIISCFILFSFSIIPFEWAMMEKACRIPCWFSRWCRHPSFPNKRLHHRHPSSSVPNNKRKKGKILA